MNTLKTIDEAIEALQWAIPYVERLRDAEKLKQSLNKLKALRKQWDYERQDFEKIEPMGDEELFKIELRVMSQMLNDEKNEGDLRLARLILRLHKAEKTLEALRDKLGSEELVEGMEAQDILNRCINLNDYIYREDPEYYGDYYVTLFNELHRLKAVIKAMGV